MTRVKITKSAIKLQVTLRIKACPSVTLENKIVNSLLPNPRAADFGSVNKIKKIISKPIKIQRLSIMLIL